MPQAMQSHEVLREVFQSTSAKQIAADLGLSLSLIYKWAETPPADAPPGGGNPLDRVDQLIRCTNDPRIIQWLCHRSGGFFIPNPKSQKPNPEFLIPATNSVVHEFADLLAVIATSAADNSISPGESRTIRQRWEDLKSVTESFVAGCEEGHFDRVRAAIPASGLQMSKAS